MPCCPQENRLIIELERQVFRPGDLVRGAVVAQLIRPLWVDLVDVVLHGEASVHWIEEICCPGGGHTCTPVEQKKPLLNLAARVWQHPTLLPSSHDQLLSKDSEQKKFVGLEAGVHRFPFEFVLPREGLSTTFSVSDCDRVCADVKYSIRAIALSTGMLNRTAVRDITIVVENDLNDIPIDLLEPAKGCNTLHMKHGKVSACMTLPKTGFVPGEKIRAAIRIENHSDASIKYAAVNVLRKTNCFVNSPRYSMRTHFHESCGVRMPQSKIKCCGSVDWVAELPFPALSPSFTIDGIIDTECYVQLSIGFERDKPKEAQSIVKIPVVIGSSPQEVVRERGLTLPSAPALEGIPPSKGRGSSLS